MLQASHVRRAARRFPRRRGDRVHRRSASRRQSRTLLSAVEFRPISRPISAASCRSRRSPRSCRSWSTASNGGATACRPSPCARHCPDGVQPNDVATTLYSDMQEPLRDQPPARLQDRDPGWRRGLRRKPGLDRRQGADHAGRHRRAADGPAAALRQGDAGAGSPVRSASSVRPPHCSISGAPFGFVAILGVIALLGIIMRNSIILVDQIDQDIAARHGSARRRSSARRCAASGRSC